MSRHSLALATVAGLTLLSLSACVSPRTGGISGGGEALSPEERRLQAVENKVAAFQRRFDTLDSSRADDNLAKLRDELRDLRGQVEKLSFDVRQQDERSKQLYVDLDQRLRALEGGAAPAGGAGYGVLAPTAPPAAGAAGAAGSAVSAAPPVTGGGVVQLGRQNDPDEEAAYLTTFDLLKNGKYDDAITGFKAHLQKYPQGQYADNAAYWLGEASYVKRDYKSAAEAFNRVATQHPQSPRAPDAMFKLALTQQELKQDAEARTTLEQVISRYPNSNAARLAQQRLQGGN